MPFRQALDIQEQIDATNMKNMCSWEVWEKRHGRAELAEEVMTV